MGKHFLDVFVGNTLEYKVSTGKAEKTSVKSKAFEKFMFILFLRASDQGKYGKMQDECCTDYSNKKENYPKSIVDMVDVMRQVKISLKNLSPSDKEKPMMMRKRIQMLSLRRVSFKRNE